MNFINRCSFTLPYHIASSTVNGLHLSLFRLIWYYNYYVGIRKTIDSRADLTINNRVQTRFVADFRIRDLGQRLGIFLNIIYRCLPILRMIGKYDMNPSSIDVVFELILNDMSAVFLLDIVYYVKQWVDEYRMCGVWTLVISNKSLAFVILY